MINKLGIKILRFKNEEIKDINKVKDEIMKELSPCTFSLKREGEKLSKDNLGVSQKNKKTKAPMERNLVAMTGGHCKEKEEKP